jgi:hypothetical protein
MINNVKNFFKIYLRKRNVSRESRSQVHAAQGLEAVYGKGNAPGNEIADVG